MKVSFYLESPKGSKRNPEGQNQTAIFTRICYEGYKVKYYTPESIFPAFWNANTKPHRAKETKKFPEYPEFNRRLDNIEATIKNVIRKYINDNNGQYPTPATLKPLLDTAIRNGGNVAKVTLLSFFEDHIQKCKSGSVKHISTGKAISSATVKTYETTLLNLKRYSSDLRRKVDFENIDLDFYQSFTDYLATYTNEASGKGKQTLNTVGKSIKVLKSILNEATEKGLNTNLAYKSKKFLTVSEDVDTIYLTESELKQIYELNLTGKPRLEAVRDLFIVGCYTGLRFSDLSTLRPEQISGNLITITQIKTGKPVVIPVHDTVSQIMAKYKGHLPKPRSNQKANEYIKEVCKEIAVLKLMVSVSGTTGKERVTDTCCKWELVSTHTARRSFATNEYLAGTPSLTIMAITGHKTEKSFLKYIRVTPDQHAKILQGIWEERKSAPVKTIAI